MEKFTREHRGNITHAKRLVAHLIRWGEIAAVEVPGIAGAAEWLVQFEEAGLVTPVKDEQSVCAWSLSPRCLSLLAADETRALRLALFQVPEYRRYLMGILAEGLASAAKQTMNAQIEIWTGNELLPFLDEINSIFDELEIYGRRLVDENSGQLVKQFAKLEERSSDWTAWDQLLLGGTGRAQELFDFVLTRFAPDATIPARNHEERVPALLPVFPLLDGDGKIGMKKLQPDSWNIRRSSVRSSLALFDERGNALVETGSPEDFRQSVQDALLEQPFYTAIVHLAINSYRANAALTPAVELYLPPAKSFEALALYFEGQCVGSLQELLPGLLHCQNCFSAATISAEAVAAMLEDLLALEILQHRDDMIVIHPDFCSSLMAGRLRSVYRPGKVLQAAMLEKIEHYARAKGKENT